MISPGAVFSLAAIGFLKPFTGTKINAVITVQWSGKNDEFY